MSNNNKTIRKTREQESVHDETYTPPSSYDLPPEIREAFESKGFHLRWIRVLIENQDDYKNVADRRREGYEPVTILELPDHTRDLFETRSLGNAAAKYSNIAMVGDLALFKIKLGKAQARQRYYESVALNNEAAQIRQLGGNSKINRMLPIVNESRTTVRVGSRKNAPEEFGKTLKETTIDDSSVEDDE